MIDVVDEIFISYRHEPADASYVEQLAEFLTRRGISVWFDREIVTGDRWVHVIAERVEACAAMIVVMTPEAEASEWVAKEIARAAKLRKPIFPLLLRGGEFFSLADIQFEDVTDERMPSKRFVEQLQHPGRVTNPGLRRDPRAVSSAPGIQVLWAGVIAFFALALHTGIGLAILLGPDGLDDSSSTGFASFAASLLAGVAGGATIAVGASPLLGVRGRTMRFRRMTIVNVITVITVILGIVFASPTRPGAGSALVGLLISLMATFFLGLTDSKRSNDSAFYLGQEIGRDLADGNTTVFGGLVLGGLIGCGFGVAISASVGHSGIGLGIAVGSLLGLGAWGAAVVGYRPQLPGLRQP